MSFINILNQNLSIVLVNNLEQFGTGSLNIIQIFYELWAQNVLIPV